MKYMQNGSFQDNSLIRLTLLLTMLFLLIFWATNFVIFFTKLGVTPESIQQYYLGSEEQFRMPRTYQAMLEITHAHLPMMALVMLLITHLFIFLPLSTKTKIALILSGFSFALLNESAGWLVRFIHPGFAWMKLATFWGLQCTIGYLILRFVYGLLQRQKTGITAVMTGKEHTDSDVRHYQH
jgi:hypothetical protein